MSDREQRIDRAASGILLAIVLGMLAGNLLLPMVVSTEDLLKYYTIAALVLELLLLYAPGDRLLKLQGGPARKASLAELSASAMLGVGMMFVSAALNALSTILFESIGIEAISSPMPEGVGWRLAASTFVLGVVPAIAEETFFRGGLLTAWLPLGEKRAIVRTALLFALIHFQPTSFLALLPISLLLGLVAVRTRTIGAPIALHMGNNIPAVLISSLAAAEPEAAEYSLIEALPSSLFYLALGTAVAFFAWKALTKCIPEEEIQKVRAEEAAAARVEAEQQAAEEPPIPQVRPGRTPEPISGRVLLLLAYLALIGTNAFLLFMLAGGS